MTRDQFIAAHASALGCEVGYARARYMTLRDKGVMPKGSGKRSPDLGFEHSAAFILALAIETEIKTAAEQAAVYFTLPHRLDGSDLTAGAAIADVLRDLADGHSPTAVRITVCRSWPEIMIEDKGEMTDYFANHAPSFELGKWGSWQALRRNVPYNWKFVRTITEIEGLALSGIAKSIRNSSGSH